MKRQHNLSEITDPDDRVWVARLRTEITRLTRLDPKHFYKTLKSKPLTCLPFTIWLKRELVTMQSFKARKIAILPIIGFKSSVTSHIKFDTTCILSYLFGSHLLNKVSKQITSLKNAIWNKFFSTNGRKMLNKVLKQEKKKLFVGEIITNGHSCSLTFAVSTGSATPLPVLSENAYKPPPTGATIPIALNNPTVVPTESIQQSTVITDQSNQSHSSSILPTVVANSSKRNRVVSNQESNSQVDPTLSSNKKSRNNDELSAADKRKLEFANVLYGLEVDGDENDDDNIPSDRKDKLKSIAELEEFADQSYLNKNAPYIPYIHQLSSKLKAEIIANNNLKYAAFDLGVRDIFKMITIPDNNQKFCKPTPRNSITLNYTSKARNYNLQVKQREKWLNKYKKKKFVHFEGVKYSIKKFESEIVNKQLRFTDSSYQDFVAYSRTKTKFESVLKKFHESTYVKSLKHQAYQSKQKEYYEIAKRIKKKLRREDASDCLLIVGDVSISTHLKGNRPACWKGMIRYLKKEGFKILRIEEYHSSKLCCNCRKFNKEKISNENWLKCKRTYGKQKGKMLPVFALFKCACCRSIKQRDLNAVVNMYEYGIHQLHGRIMNEFVIPDGVREKWLLNSRNYSHTAFKDKYRCY